MLDVLIDGALIVDGSGRPSFRGAVGVTADRIAFVRPEEAPTETPEAAHHIDAAGRALAPGFVDVHNHSDLAPLVEPEMASAVRQGVTTLVVGNCGSSPWPRAGAPECALLVGGDPGSRELGWPSFGSWMEAMAARRPAVNMAALVGHGAVRLEVMGRDRRAPTGKELRAMRAMVAEAMQDGAAGLSTGLIYVPGIYSVTDEIVALAGEVAATGGIYASHIRGEGANLFAAVDEAMRIGRLAGLPVQVSHLKCETAPLWGRTDTLLARFHGGDDVTADQYPYTAWESGLESLLPPWAPVAEVATIARAEHDRLKRAVEEGEPDFGSCVTGVGWDRIVVEGGPVPAEEGRSVAQVAAERGLDPFDAFVALLREKPDTGCIGHAMAEDDVRAILADPGVMVASDGMAMSPTGPLGSQPVHPRSYGTFPRVLGTYVRAGVLSLEAAVRKMTALPAARFGLRDRGELREGAFADLVLFDPSTIEDTAVFGAPHSFPRGIDMVLVNGEVAWDSGAESDGARGAGAGRMLTR